MVTRFKEVDVSEIDEFGIDGNNDDCPKVDRRPDCVENMGMQMISEMMRDQHLADVLAELQHKVSDFGDRYANKIKFEVTEPMVAEEGARIEGRINFWRVEHQYSDLVFSFDMRTGEVSIHAETLDQIPDHFNGYQSRTRKQYFTKVEELIQAMRFGVSRFKFDRDTKKLFDAYRLVSGRDDNQ